MLNVIYIANNEADVVDIPISEYEAVAEVQQNSASNKAPSELSFVAGKLFVSFGALLICIAIFLVLAFLYKRKLTKTSGIIDDAGFPLEKEELPQPKAQVQSSASTLNTPNSLNKCIRSFLENTRDV